jgi:hypothetical protein
MKQLHEHVAQIRTKEDLVSFIEALGTDLKENPGSWENPTLESFLAALASWVEDSEGYYRNQGLEVPEAPTWRGIGEMLTAARTYE